MSTKRKVIMVGATLLLAAATGHLMQGGPGTGREAAAPPTGPGLAAASITSAAPVAEPPVAIVPLAGRTEPVAVVARAGMGLPATRVATPPVVTLAMAHPAMVPPAVPKTLFAPPAAAAYGAIAPERLMEVATRSISDPTALSDGIADDMAAAPDCTPALKLTPAPAAMIGLVLEAPCNPDARVVIRHAGLTITGVTSGTGAMQATIPALAAAAHVIAALPDGSSASADITIPSLADYDRVAVQWQGKDAFELHAFEFGADYGDPGHVSATNPRVPTVALQAKGGFLTELGDAKAPLPMLAQVYTFPSGRSENKGAVSLTIEALVSVATCGREMLGETLTTQAGQPVTVVDLSVVMPGCEAVGDFVVLNNLLPDVMVAGN